jgi:hypothetical protein
MFKKVYDPLILLEVKKWIFFYGSLPLKWYIFIKNEKWEETFLEEYIQKSTKERIVLDFKCREKYEISKLKYEKKKKVIEQKFLKLKYIKLDEVFLLSSYSDKKTVDVCIYLYFLDKKYCFIIRGEK